MKNFAFWIVAVLSLAVGSMTVIHLRESALSRTRVGEIESLFRRQAASSQMALELERYRRASGSFRRLGMTEETSAKARLTREIGQGTELLAQLTPTAEEQAIASKVRDRLAEFFVLSAKLEPQLFTRDVFQKPEARNLLDSMGTNLESLAQSAVGRAQAAKQALSVSARQSTRLIFFAASLVLGLVALILARNYFVLVRPLRSLLTSTRERLGGEVATKSLGKSTDKPTGVAAICSEISSSIHTLYTSVEAHRRERHQFITAVASGIRTPLAQLHTGTELLTSVGSRLDPEQREHAQEAVRRSMFRLSKTLDDLSDIVDSEQSELRLDEKIVDLSELAVGVARDLSGIGATHEITASVPASGPVWTLIDPQRFERVLVNLVTKLTAFVAPGGGIDISLAWRGKGLELVVQDAERARASRSGQAAQGGPEQELLRHWVSENGFGMSLAQKIARSHGATITASGVAGGSVQFMIRIPEVRVASALISQGSPARGGSGLRVPALELARLQSMFPKEAINFGS